MADTETADQRAARTLREGANHVTDAGKPAAENIAHDPARTEEATASVYRLAGELDGMVALYIATTDSQSESAAAQALRPWVGGKAPNELQVLVMAAVATLAKSRKAQREIAALMPEMLQLADDLDRRAARR